MPVERESQSGGAEPPPSSTRSIGVDHRLPAEPEGASAPGRGLEIGGPKGPEPTRYGDWERAGRCIDF
jgi:hypothetical protein